VVFIREHGLSIALVALWIVLLGASGFFATEDWWESTLLNHASGAFGAAIVVILTKYLYERGSAASKDLP
jgi:hypothetical protein